MKITKSTLKELIKEEIANIKETLTGDPFIDAQIMAAMEANRAEEEERREAGEKIKAATGPERAALEKAELERQLKDIPSLEQMLIADPETKKALELIGRIEKDIDFINKEIAQNAKNYEKDNNEGQYRENVLNLYPRRKKQQAKLDQAEQFVDAKADEFLKKREKMVADAKARLGNMTRN